MYDTVIKNAKIIDGTGSPSYNSDLAILNGKIIRISRNIKGKAKETIDASGLILAPGFIDSHSHSDLILDEDKTCYYILYSTFPISA